MVVLHNQVRFCDKRGTDMNAEEMLEKVQSIKEELVKELIGIPRDSAVPAKELAMSFFSEHYAQVLDILDDACYAYLTDGKVM